MIYYKAQFYEKQTTTTNSHCQRDQHLGSTINTSTMESDDDACTKFSEYLIDLQKDYDSDDNSFESDGEDDTHPIAACQDFGLEGSTQ
jgi:hypothetical protein